MTLFCRVREDILGKEQPPLLNDKRKDVGQYLEETGWLKCGDSTPWENEEGIVEDEYGNESAYSFCFYLPSGKMVWGVSVDFDFEDMDEDNLQQEA